jgi:putative phosphoribosyl transferase
MNRSAIASADVVIPVEGVVLRGNLATQPDDRGIVVFAHGTGSSRFSRRNRYVAGTLEAAGFSTLLFDLLTADEERQDERTRTLRFDVHMLAVASSP